MIRANVAASSWRPAPQGVDDQRQRQTIEPQADLWRAPATRRRAGGGAAGPAILASGTPPSGRLTKGARQASRAGGNRCWAWRSARHRQAVERQADQDERRASSWWPAQQGRDDRRQRARHRACSLIRASAGCRAGGQLLRRDDQRQRRATQQPGPAWRVTPLHPPSFPTSGGCNRFFSDFSWTYASVLHRYTCYTHFRDGQNRRQARQRNSEHHNLLIYILILQFIIYCSRPPFLNLGALHAVPKKGVTGVTV